MRSPSSGATTTRSSSRSLSSARPCRGRIGDSRVEDFESARIRRDSALGALQDVVSRPDGVATWAEMDLPRFISPIAKGERLEVLDLDGKALNIQPGDSPAVIIAEPLAEGWRSAPFELRARSKGPLEESELDDLGVRVSAGGVTFVVESKGSSDDGVVLRGYLAVAKRARLAPVSLKSPCRLPQEAARPAG